MTGACNGYSHSVGAEFGGTQERDKGRGPDWLLLPYPDSQQHRVTWWAGQRVVENVGKHMIWGGAGGWTVSNTQGTHCFNCPQRELACHVW